MFIFKLQRQYIFVVKNLETKYKHKLTEKNSRNIFFFYILSFYSLNTSTAFDQKVKLAEPHKNIDYFYWNENIKNENETKKY